MLYALKNTLTSLLCSARAVSQDPIKGLFIIAANHHNVSVLGTTPIEKLDLSDYVKQTLSQGDFKTVEEVLYSYCMHEKIPGMGEKSWKAFFEAIK